MTTDHIAYATIATLLIAGLMLYLRGKFKKIGLYAFIDDWKKEVRQRAFNDYLDASEKYYDIDISYKSMVADGIIKPDQPKRRKYRDSK